MRSVVSRVRTTAHAMRLKINNVISPTTANRIASKLGPREFWGYDIADISHTIQSLVPVDFSHPSYCCVESKPDGHGWHCDTGNMNHMKWCGYSASVLLTPPSSFGGGQFYFRSDHRSLVHYLDLLIFSSDEEHCVRPHTGDRRVLLMFIKEK